VARLRQNSISLTTLDARRSLIFIVLPHPIRSVPSTHDRAREGWAIACSALVDAAAPSGGMAMVTAAWGMPVAVMVQVRVRAWIYLLGKEKHRRRTIIVSSLPSDQPHALAGSL
jgi:hypothetical protein